MEGWLIMAEQSRVITEDGLKHLEDELQYLKTEKREEIQEKLKEARAQGDLSENAEYDAAKDEQSDVEKRISEIEAFLQEVEDGNIKVINEEQLDRSRIDIGCKVLLHDVTYDEDIEYTITGSTEANLLEGKISNESPLGQAIIGRIKGETVEVETPGGIEFYEIKDFKFKGNE
jgi:transcription elongation factor GreA